MNKEQKIQHAIETLMEDIRLNRIGLQRTTLLPARQTALHRHRELCLAELRRLYGWNQRP